jgi:hypothetical protein
MFHIHTQQNTYLSSSAADKKITFVEEEPKIQKLLIQLYDINKETQH